MNAHGFCAIDVSGDTYTVTFYKQGVTTPQKTYTFTKSTDTIPRAPSNLWKTNLTPPRLLTPTPGG